MPSYHCSVKTGGKGRAGKHGDYISREGKYSPEMTKGNRSKLEDLEHTASGNMPAWASHDHGIFWRAADEHERANGATYREIEVALPRELNPAQRRELVEDFVRQQIGDRHPYTYAIHVPKAAIEKGEQPHAHIMYSERTLDGIARDPDLFFKRASPKTPEKGGCRKDSAGTKERLLATRELWADVQNRHLEKAGIAERVTHLSLKAQGIDRQPEKHLGPVDARQVNASALLEHRAAERELAQVPRVDAAAELVAQAQARQDARETFRQVQAAEAARRQAQAQQAREAQQQAAQAQADREATRQAAREARRQAEAEAQREVARQAVQAQREAAAQAQARQEANESAEAKKKAINTKLTAPQLHRAEDLELVRRAQELFSQPLPDGYARHTLQRDISSAMSAAVREISDTEPRHASADAERAIKEQQNEAARRAGQPEPWKAGQTACAWVTIAFGLERERREHLETKRPSGIFSGSAAKEYDAKTASITSQLDNVRRATETLKAELQAKLAAQAQQAAQRDPQRHAEAKERHEGLMLLHKAVGDASREIDAERERAHGHDRENDNDFGL